MKTLILAGGLGTRLSEYTHLIPKPMVTIGDKPILHHIIDTYVKYNQKSFLILTGYKSEVIVEYFVGEKNKAKLDDNNYIRVKDYNDKFIKEGIDIDLLYTGENTMTGGRIKRAENYIDTNSFMVTYGDGLSNINISALINFHAENQKIGTVTAVRPPARFGELEINKHAVTKFEEKPQLQKGWINGGFFVFEKIFFNFIEDDSIMLEREPLINLTNKKNLSAYKHEDFWQCMDNKRDRDYLEKLFYENNAPWIK